MKRLIYLAVATTLFATGVLADKPSVRPTPRPRPLPGGQHLFASVAGGRVDEFARNRMQFTFASGLRSPRGLAFDSAGNLFVATTVCAGTTCNATILRIAPDGTQSLFGTIGDSFAEGLTIDSADNVFVVSLDQPPPWCHHLQVYPGRHTERLRFPS